MARVRRPAHDLRAATSVQRRARPGRAGRSLHEGVMPRHLDDRTAFRSLVRRTLVLPLVLVALLALGVVAEILHLASLHRWVDHTDQTIAQANNVQKLYLDSETGLRGFVLTGLPEFLEPYTSARTALPSALASLRAMVEDNPRQLGRLDAIAARGDAWLEVAEHRISETRRGEAVPRQESIDGKARMDAIRLLVREFIATEEGLRLDRSRETQRSSAIALWATVLATLALGGAMAVLGRRQLVGLSGKYEAVLSEQLRQTEALQRQGWASRGRAHLVDEVRGDIDE